MNAQIPQSVGNQDRPFKTEQVSLFLRISWPMLQNHHASACHPGVGWPLINCRRLTPTSTLGLFAQIHKEALTVLGKACYVTHFSKNEEIFFCCLAQNRLGRIRNSVKKEVIQPSKLTFRERAKQTSICHFQDRTEWLLNTLQKMLL